MKKQKNFYTIRCTLKIITALTSVITVSLGALLTVKSLSAYRKLNQALDLYISEHKYRIARDQPAPYVPTPAAQPSQEEDDSL